MTETGRTGFSNVDAAADSGELVDYLALAADRLTQQRRAGFEMLRLAEGSAVLDVGCGAGEVCVELAARVGTSGSVTGIDPSEAMIAAAKRASARSGRVVDLRVASVYELPFPDGAFDAVRAERVFQHLEDPETALREMSRVTRRGGRVMVIDPDHGQHGMSLDDLQQHRVFAATVSAMLRMIANPHSGTRLRSMFIRAGMAEIGQSISVFESTYPDFQRLFFFPERINSAIDAGDITPAEGADLVAQLEERHRLGTFYANVIGYTVSGTRPA